jgi:hypothetical protein
MSNEEILSKQVQRGKNAERAYKIYVKEFIDSRMNLIFEQLKNGDAVQEIELQPLKIALIAINDLQNSILSDIRFGKEAEQKLGENIS